MKGDENRGIVSGDVDIRKDLNKEEVVTCQDIGI